MRRPAPTGPVRFEVYLDRDLHRRLRMASIEEGLSAAAIVRSLVEGWVNGQNRNDDALRAAYDAGVRAERNRIRAVVDSAAPVERPDTSTRPGVPLRPPSAGKADTSIDLDSRCTDLDRR